MKEYDFSAFNAGVEESRKSSAESGERMLPSQEPDTLDDFLTGAAQGATFGFSDEIGAAIDVLRGRAPADAKTLMDAFRVLQKAREAEIEKAKERSPYAALAGELIGGFAVPIPGALAAGAGKVLKITPALQKLGVGEKLAQHIGTGAAVGGLAGLGTSKGAIEESPTELLKDIGVSGLTGGAIGGVLGKALDKVIATKEAVKKYPSIQKGLAAMEGAEGKTAGMEGKQILTEEVPTILPGEEPTGAQQFLNLAQKEISSEAERAVEIQRQAKDNLNKAISDNLKTPSMPENTPKSLIDEMNNSVTQARDYADELLYKENKAKFRDMILQNIKEGNPQKNNQNTLVSEFLSNPENKSISNIHGDRLNSKRTEIELNALRKAEKELNDPNFTTYVDNLEKLMKVADARQWSDGKTFTNKELIPIRRALEKIDPNFILKIKQDPTGLNIGDLYNFRQNFLQRAKDKALDLDLDFQQRELLFGKRNPNTGKYDGGIFDAIENVMKSSSKDLKSFINNVDEKSRHIEALLNEHPDPNFHGLKAWDFKNNKDLKLELYNILSDKLTSSKAGSVQSYEAANILKNYFETMLAGETDPVKRKAIEESAKLLDERSKMLASITERAGIDRVSGDSVSAYDPTKMLQHGKESSVPKLFETLGRMKKSVGEDIEEIPSVARKAIAAPFTAPFKFKNATEEQLKKAAELLKSSKNASVRQFGEGISESATKSPAVRNAIIHSAFQRADIREALGLSLNDEDKDKK